MSDTGKFVILGAIAASLTIGAVQFASGHDLTGVLIGNSLASASAVNANAVNRSAKADRAESLPASVSQMKTISLRLSQFTDTSFLLRIPSASAAKEVSGNGSNDSAPPSQLLIKSDGAKLNMKRPVACEPSVSVLTEIAKSLQPGRCVT
jgi:hypothetical protein